MAGKSIGIEKAPKLYDKICSMMFDFTTTGTGTTAETVCAVKTVDGSDVHWDPYCEPMSDRNCLQQEGSHFLPMIKITLTWTDCDAAGMGSDCKVNYIHASGGGSNGYYNGQTRYACPSSYTLKGTSGTYGTYFDDSYYYNAQEKWIRGGVQSERLNQDLKLERRAYSVFRQTNFTPFSGIVYRGYVSNTNHLIINKRNNNVSTDQTNSDRSFFYLSSFQIRGGNNPRSDSYSGSSIRAYMGVMNTGVPSLGDYRLGGGMFVTWTDPVTTITYKFEKGPYWNCLEKPFELTKQNGIVSGSTAPCAAMYTTQGGPL